MESSITTWSVTPPYLQLDSGLYSNGDWSNSKILPNDQMDLTVTAEEAGFRGAINLGRYHMVLPRGNVHPTESLPPDWRERFLWYEPDDSEPELFYVNKNGFLYRLRFEPVESEQV